jgi:hypothetical protein
MVGALSGTFGKVVMTVRVHRFVLAGALTVAAVAAPIAIALTSGGVAATNAGPPCLATVTSNGGEPVCVSYSNGNGINVGTPDFGIYGPNGQGIGVTTGNLLPGQTWTSP